MAAYLRHTSTLDVLFFSAVLLFLALYVFLCCIRCSVKYTTKATMPSSATCVFIGAKITYHDIKIIDVVFRADEIPNAFTELDFSLEFKTEIHPVVH